METRQRPRRAVSPHAIAPAAPAGFCWEQIQQGPQDALQIDLTTISASEVKRGISSKPAIIPRFVLSCSPYGRAETCSDLLWLLH